jgi:N6-adenosine-specific RNA methylase IME4
MTLPIHPLAELFPPLDGAAFAALKADIAANGLQENITLWRGAVIDGRNRFRALVELGEVTPDGKPTRDDRFMFQYFSEWSRSYPETDLVAFVVSKNLHRRHLSESQRAVIAARLATMGQGRPASHQSDKPADLPDVDGGAGAHAARSAVAPDDRPPSPDLRSDPPREGEGKAPRSSSPQGDSATNAISQGAAAAMMNVSERSVRTARVLFTGPIEIVDEVMAGRESVDGAAKRLKAAKVQAGDDDPSAIAAAYTRLKAERDAAQARKKAEKLARRAQREQELGAKIAAASVQIDGMIAAGQRFGVILADPEWQFETYGEGGMDRSADNHYPTTPVDQIMARPVRDLAADDAALFLWATAPMLPEALAVMAAWGFTYKSHLVWLKDRMGTGYWFRNRHELLLVGTRGRFVAPAPGTQWSSALAFPVGEHSEKPPFAHEMIEALWPSLPKLEMNARAARPGWTVWGAEAPEMGVPGATAPQGRSAAAPDGASLPGEGQST